MFFCSIAVLENTLLCWTLSRLFSSDFTLCFPLLNICCNFALRATGWMSGHRRGGKKNVKKKRQQKQTRNVMQPASERGPGQAKCRRATSLWSAPWQLDAPWHSAAKPDHVSLFWWENQTNGSLEVYFSAANLLSKHRELHTHTHMHVYTHTHTLVNCT